MAKENLKSYFTGISHTIVSVLADFSHTLHCCLSKPKNSLEAGKKLPIVWREDVCSFKNVLLRVPMVVRSELEEGYECCFLTNMRENDNEVGFVASRTYVYTPMSHCLLWTFNITIGGIVYKCLIRLPLSEVLVLSILILPIIILKAYSYGK